MMYGTDAFETPVRYMLENIPQGSVLGSHIIMADHNEFDLPQINDCRETSDGNWVVLEYMRRKKRKAIFIKKEDLSGFYLFYVHNNS